LGRRRQQQQQQHIKQPAGSQQIMALQEMQPAE
jgi:hypothetical protein